MTTRSNEIAVHGLSVLVIGVLWLRQIADGSLREFYFISDHLYVPALVEDLWQRSGKLSEWRLTPSPYVWPDMLLYLGLRPFTVNLEQLAYACGLAQFVLIFASARLLLRKTFPAPSALCMLVGPAFIVWVVIHSGRWVPLVAPLFVISCHGRAVFASFLTLALCFGAQASGRREWVLMAVTALLAAASDPLYVASCSVPLIVLGFWSRSTSMRKPEHAGPCGIADHRSCFWNSAWGCVGLAIVRLCNVRSTRGYVQPRPWSVSSALTQLTADAVTASRFEFALLLGMFVLALVVWFRPSRSTQGETLRSLAVWQAASLVSTVSASVLTGRYAGDGALRYFLVAMTSGAVFVAAAGGVRVCESKWVLTRAWSTIMACVGGGLVLAIVVHSLPALARGQYASNLRTRGSCVAAVARREGVDTVLADYWNAKPLMLFMPGSRLTALQMLPGLAEPRWWINSRGWYRGTHRFGVVVTNDLDPTAIRQRYGAPDLVEHCAELELYVYRGQAREQLSQSLTRSFTQFLAAP